MSSAFCPAVRIFKFGKNPNSDNLMIWNGPHGPVQFAYGSIVQGDLAMYVPPGHVVDTSISEFGFLKGKSDHEGKFVVKPTTLRGIPSVGLLIPLGKSGSYVAPRDGLDHIIAEGNDLSGLFWIEKFQSPEFTRGSDGILESSLRAPKYDVQGFSKVKHQLGDAVNMNIVWSMTEKIHGANMRFGLHNGKTIIGSRSTWKNCQGSGEFSRAYKQNQKMMDQLSHEFPDLVFYGEVFGNVQDIKYSMPKDVDYRMFDAYDIREGRFWSPAQLMTMLVAHGYSNKYVPLLITNLDCTFDEAVTVAKSEIENANGLSLIDGKSIMQGIVIRPRNLGRPIAKVINPKYITRKCGTQFR